MNRIKAAIHRMGDQIQERIALGLTTEARVEATRKALDMGMEEFARFQEIKSLASQLGTLTLGEAQHIYTLLGETPEHFNGQDVATKAVLNQVFRDLLEGSMKS